MKALTYIAICVPAVLMIIAGLAISMAKRDTTMTSHHFARNFNIKNYSKQIMTLFSLTGIVFSLSGILIINNLLAAGLIIIFIMLIIFIVFLSIIQRKN